MVQRGGMYGDGREVKPHLDHWMTPVEAIEILRSWSKMSGLNLECRDDLRACADVLETALKG